MMKIRKRGEIWEVRRNSHNQNSDWIAYENLDELREVIIDVAVDLDHGVRLALDVINGTSEIYTYQHGGLIRRKPFVSPVCLTPHIQAQKKIETIIKLVSSGVWNVRKWKVPKCLAHFAECSWMPDDLVKESYTILETNDDSIVPHDLEILAFDL